MSVNDSWPYIDSRHRCESDRHVRLKNLAVHWLLSRGFSPEEVEQERRYGPASGYGRTDIYAESGGVKVFVECETGDFAGLPDLSRGGSLPAKDGEAVYVFCSDGIFIVEKELRTLSSNQWGDDIEREVLTFNRISSLPFVDLSAYK